VADEPRFSFCSLGLWLGIIDVCMVLLAVAYTVLATRSWIRPKAERAKASDRSVAAVGSAIAISATGASVLMAAVGVLLGLGGGEQRLADQAHSQLVLTAVWLVSSLVCASLCSSYVITHIHEAKSIAEHPLVIGCATVQLVTLVFGGLFFVIGLFLL
jgi:hypothetical protein